MANGKNETTDPGLATSPGFVQGILHWLASRQTCMLADYRDLDNLEADEADFEEVEESQPIGLTGASSFTVLGSAPVLAPQMLDFESFECQSTADVVAGMNGRCNKPADTCYSFWAGASLAVRKAVDALVSIVYKEFDKYLSQILGKISLLDKSANRRYLLGKTQHRIGGFSKFPGDPPGESNPV